MAGAVPLREGDCTGIHGGGGNHDGPELGALPGQSRCAAACDRRGRLRLVAAVAAERELDRRDDRPADRLAPALRLRCVPGSQRRDIWPTKISTSISRSKRARSFPISAAISSASKKGGAGAEPLARLLRQAHTLKGAARVVRLPRIAEIAHAMEDALTPHRGSPDAVSRRADRPAAAAGRYDFVGDKSARPAAAGRCAIAPVGARAVRARPRRRGRDGRAAERRLRNRGPARRHPPRYRSGQAGRRSARGAWNNS